MNTYDKFFIGGEWVEPAGNETLKVVSPTSEEVIGSVPVATSADMDRAVAAAKAAFEGEWSTWTPEDRAELLQRIADGIKSRQDDFTNLIVSEVGAPYYFSMFGQTLAAAMVLRRLRRPHPGVPVRRGPPGHARRADPRAPRAGRRVRRHHPVERAAVHHRSLKLGPALASGSTIVLKPAPETPLDANVLAEILVEAGVPGRRGEHRRRRPRGGRAPGAPPRHRQGQLHRLHRRRPQDRRHLR